MKKTNLSALTLLALGMAGFGNQAIANETANYRIYGMLNVGVQHSDYVDGALTEVESYASRFGLDGSYRLNSGVELVYQLEWQVDVTDLGGSGNLNSRNQFIGLQGDFGRILAGRLETSTKFTQGGYDIFGDLPGDISSVLAGKSDLGNAVGYSSASFNGLQAHATYVFSESHGESDGQSAALTYASDMGWSIATSFDRDIDNFDIDRVVAYGSIGAARVGVLFQQQKNLLTGEKADGFSVNAGYRVGDWFFKTQYQTLDLEAGKDSRWSVGADYILSEKTKLFIWFTDSDNKSTDISESFAGIGLSHSF